MSGEAIDVRGLISGRWGAARTSVALVVITILLLSGVPAMALTLPEPPTFGPRLQALLDAPDTELHNVALTVDGETTSALLDDLGALGLETLALQHIPVVVARGTAAQLAGLEFVPGIESAWLDAPLEQAMAESRAVLNVDAVQQELGFDGSGVGIAVIDSGVEATHLDLELGTKTVQNVKVAGFQGTAYSGPLTALAVPVEDVPDTDLVTGHGTHVAGIAAGNGARSNGRLRGVASGADLIGVGVGDVYLVTTLAGYDWVLSNRELYDIRVINNSWADSEIPYDETHPLNVASKAAYDAGIVVVQAAGNSGQASGDVYNRYAAPAWVLGVGGVDKLGRLGAYSSRGTTEHHADVVAVGSFIASTMAVTGVYGVPNQTPLDLTDPAAPRILPTQEIPYYTVKVGTSMAAPHVAGIAALVLQAAPGLTPQQVMDVITGTARPVDGCLEIDCGHGLVDAAAAVAAAQDLAGPLPMPPVADVVATPASGAAPLTTTLDASGSTDVDGVVVSYDWDLGGDGVVDTTTTTPTLSHTFGAGRHTVAVTAVDDQGLRSNPAFTQVEASSPPTASAEVPERAKESDTVTLDASASSDADGSIVSYTFDLGDGTVVTQSTPALTYSWEVERATRFVWVVTVTDDAGISDATRGTIMVTPGGGGGG